jgi:hypothetical protein
MLDVVRFWVRETCGSMRKIEESPREEPMKYRALMLTVALTGVALPALGAADWFPAQFEEGAARQFIGRLAEIGVEVPGTEEEKLAKGIGRIQDLVARVDGWNADGVVGRAPALDEIDLPKFDDRIVRALAVYGICALPLHPELVETTDELVYVASGEIGVAVLAAFLRHQFLAAGGTDQDLAGLLNTDAMNKLSYDIQVSEEQRNYVAAECGPMFIALFGG